LSRRARAGGFAALAVLCAIASGSIASSYRDNVDEQLGELRTVLVVTDPLAAGQPLGRRRVKRAVEAREVPLRFVPPDALGDPGEALGRKPLAPIPPGSYLLASHLRASGPRPPATPRLGADLHPVEITVTGAGSIAALGPATGARVDVVVAGEPVTGGRARVHVAAEAIRLIALEPAPPEAAPEAGGESWSATLALDRRQALKLIEAENFAREIRLIPTG